MNTPLADLIVRRGFDRFQEGLGARFAAYRFEYTLTYCEPTDNPAIRIDLESSQQMGRLTAWVSGACEMEILDIATGERVIYEHLDLRSERDFHHALANMAVFMRDTTLPRLGSLTITNGAMAFDGGSIYLYSQENYTRVEFNLHWSMDAQEDNSARFSVNDRVIAIGSVEEALWLRRLRNAAIDSDESSPASPQDEDSIAGERPGMALSSDIQNYVDAINEGPEAALRSRVNELVKTVSSREYQSQAKYMTLIRMDADRITDWDTFHSVFAETFGFPDFYGRNMNAWIDCMSDLRHPSEGMTSVHAPTGGRVVLHMENAEAFASRCSEQYLELLRCTDFVNERNAAAGEPAALALLFLHPSESSLYGRVFEPIIERDRTRIPGGITEIQGKRYRFLARGLESPEATIDYRPIDLFDLTPVQPDPDSGSFVATAVFRTYPHPRTLKPGDPSRLEATWWLTPSKGREDPR